MVQIDKQQRALEEIVLDAVREFVRASLDRNKEMANSKFMDVYSAGMIMLALENKGKP